MHRLALVAAMCLLASTARPSGAQSPFAETCANLNGLSVSAADVGLPSGSATITAARLAPATPQLMGQTGGVIPEKPTYCEVLGEIAPLDATASTIRFQVNLPVVWNGKTLQYGGGGFNGTLTSGLDPLRDNLPDAPLPLTRGYVTYGTDSGHQGSAFPPTEVAAFALNDEALTNFAYAAYKKVNDVAQVVVRTYYGQRASHMYYFGGSEGGREGLTMAQRFPDDYDGIVSVVPVINWVGLQHAYLPNQLAQLKGGWMNPAKAAMVAQAVTDACDGLDGLTDGVVNNYLACPAHFDPHTLRCTGGSDTGDTCLSDTQINAFVAAHTPYRFPVSLANGNTEYPQWLYGGESTVNGLPVWLVGNSPPTSPVTADASRWWLFGGNTIRYFIARDPNFDVSTYDPKDFVDRIQQVSALMDSTDPDLTRFLARGGKLILRENAGDYAQSPLAGIRYYSSVVARLGQPAVDEFVRLYVSPASSHGGPMRSTTDLLDVPTYADLLDPLDDWVTNGHAPVDSLTQTLEAAAPPFEELASRPMCRYPNYPHYVGGNRRDAASYQCAPSTP
ncbi:MAG: tannase/feruloyl esterase family alpha/beta hydrolase [Chloroflexota bacterium]